MKLYVEDSELVREYSLCVYYLDAVFDEPFGNDEMAASLSDSEVIEKVLDNLIESL